MFNEIIRIGGGKPLELELELAMIPSASINTHTEVDEFHMRIVEKAALLSDYPNICTHLVGPWNPTPRFGRVYDQVRTRCRR